ncbi:DUF6192 family protein [Streptomyces sp. NRRL F-2664]|uniref:DUF6192 family protein n=1 Tax=Streptomyces sp. NRRL F-2664 TaxID=1463842 RepID=UPI002D21C86E|nr:DUF6192 family protein [Streptomyces sp. NRRL F-2664]
MPAGIQPADGAKRLAGQQVGRPVTVEEKVQAVRDLTRVRGMVLVDALADGCGVGSSSGRPPGRRSGHRGRRTARRIRARPSRWCPSRSRPGCG